MEPAAARARLRLGGMLEGLRWRWWVLCVGAACAHTDADRARMVEETWPLVEAGACERAAPRLLAVAREAPTGETATQALATVGFCEENRHRADAARPLYRRVLEEHPTSAFAPFALFRLAWLDQASGHQDQALALYRELIERFPASDDAAAGLYNAAVLEENRGGIDEALRLYERVVKEFADSRYAPSALFRVAVNAEKSSDFERAIATYGRLADEYPDSRDVEAALFNRARLFEGLTRWREAVEAYLRSVERFPEAEDAPQTLTRAGRLAERLQDPSQALPAFNAFTAHLGGRRSELVLLAQTVRAGLLRKLGRYLEAELADDAALGASAALAVQLERDTRCTLEFASDAGRPRVFRNADGGLPPPCASSEGEERTRRLLDAERLRGELLAGAGRATDAEAAYRRALALFDARGLTPERNPEAAELAAQAAFALAELLDASGRTLAIGATTTTSFEQSFKAVAENTKRVVTAFDAVGRFRQAKWTFRSRLRHAEALEHFADRIDAAAPPTSAPSQVCTHGGLSPPQALRDKADSLYESILDDAVRTGVAGDWVEGATKGLQRVRTKSSRDAGR